MSNRFEDLMVDIETMGNAPCGALVSIGACFFSIEREEIGPEFERKIHLATSVRDGGVIDASTVLFWLRQSEASRYFIAFGGEDVRVVLQDFRDWIGETCRHEDVRPWGNSPRFDMMILDTAYKRAGIAVPWYWTNERDFRTVRNLYPRVPYDTAEKSDEGHTPLYDCRFQVEHLFKIKREYRK